MVRYIVILLALSIILPSTPSNNSYAKPSNTKRVKDKDKNPKHLRVDLGPDEQRPSTVIDIYRSGELVISITVGSGANIVAGGSPPINSPAIEMEFWSSIKGSSDPEDFRAYLKKYPNGEFAELAKNRLNNIT